MLRRLAAALLVVACGVALAVSPASATSEHPSYYLALGDSLAYGFQPTHVTGQGYVDQLYAALAPTRRNLRLVNLGCPGETTASMISGGVCPYPNRPDQLDTALDFLRHNRDRVSLITIDIGANDVGHCVSAAGLDQQCVLHGLVDVALNTATITAKIRAAAPHTRIAGMTYYDPYLAASLTGPAGQALAAASLAISGELNRLLAGLFAGQGFAVADVAGAFSTTDGTTLVTLPGLGQVPLNLARICQWTWMCAPPPLGPDIHANQAGYGVIAQAFEAVL